ncbi:hypothetical protein MMC30_001233 [Trapelia coarctata]|nr:hypothetical protein [Trapelia coarctata]
MKMKQEVLDKLTAEVTKAMNINDGSHDMTHIEVPLLLPLNSFETTTTNSYLQRVMKNAAYILRTEQTAHPDRKYNVDLVHIGALMHDVGDHKYAKPGEDITRAAYNLLLSAVDNPEEYRDFAEKVQTIATNVSYTKEMKNSQKVVDLIAKIPELAIVQDADRLEQTGAAGIGRTFTYHGVNGMTMQSSRESIEDRMMKMKDHMKTETGRRIAVERTERMRIFNEWWDEETALKWV